MKNKYLLPVIALAACATIPTTPATTAPSVCVGPPRTFKGADLAQCQSNANGFFCVYPFMLPDSAKTLCYYILGQPLDNCEEPFGYVGVECVKPEETPTEATTPTSGQQEEDSWWPEPA